MTEPVPQRIALPFQGDQAHVHEVLQRFSPGAAALFEDACRLMNHPHDLKGLTRLVGHLAREIESSLRDVVRPIDSSLQKKVSPDKTALQREVRNATQSLKSCLPIGGSCSSMAVVDKLEVVAKGLEENSHRSDVESITSVLGIDRESDAAKAWDRLVGKLQKLAHRKGLGEPPPRDPGFDELWSDMNKVLAAVLGRIELHYAKFNARIDELLS